jgi:hypothetical protein
MARAPAAPARAAPPADAATSHRLPRGSSGHADRLATTSRASDRAPAATQADADPGSAAGRWSAASAPRPRARSRAPRARPNTRAARSSAAAPTQGRAGTEGQARAAAPSATRPAATAWAPRRSNSGVTVKVTCALPLSTSARLFRRSYGPTDHSPVAVTVPGCLPRRPTAAELSTTGPVTVTKLRRRPSQRVIGFGRHRAAGSAPSEAPSAPSWCAICATAAAAVPGVLRPAHEGVGASSGT